MLVTTEKMFADAKKGQYAVPAPDFWDQTSCRIFVKTAEKLHAPIILSFAEIHLPYLDLSEAASLGGFYAKKADVPVALHLDHGVHFDVIEEAVDRGFTSVMIDASSDPFAENVRKTKEAVKMAHEKGVVVEAEIGHVGVNPGDVREENESIYTEVSEAVQFVKETGVDSLAVSIGTSHGLYKGTPVINFERLAELKEAVSVPLVLHGGSSSGDDNLSRCAKGGIAKINLYTDFIVAAKKTAAGKLSAEEDAIWPDILSASSEAVSKVLTHYYKVFNLVGVSLT